MVGSFGGSFERIFRESGLWGTVDLWGSHVVTFTTEHTAHKSRRRAITLSRYERGPVSKILGLVECRLQEPQKTKSLKFKNRSPEDIVTMSRSLPWAVSRSRH